MAATRNGSRHAGFAGGEGEGGLDAALGPAQTRVRGRCHHLGQVAVVLLTGDADVLFQAGAQRQGDQPVAS